MWRTFHVMDSTGVTNLVRIALPNDAVHTCEIYTGLYAYLPFSTNAQITPVVRSLPFKAKDERYQRKCYGKPTGNHMQ
jgi:hypothetical protein